jgi:hypothetical protein
VWLKFRVEPTGDRGEVCLAVSNPKFTLTDARASLRSALPLLVSTPTTTFANESGTAIEPNKPLLAQLTNHLLVINIP